VFGDFINVSRANRSNRIILAGVNSMPTEAQINKRIKALNPRLKKYDVDLKAISTYMQSTKNKQDWPANTKVLTDQYSPANLLNF